MTNAPAPDDECYKNHANRGIAIILNHITFDSKLNFGTRLGSKQDEEHMNRMLSELNFTVMSYQDLSFMEIKKALSNGEQYT